MQLIKKKDKDKNIKSKIFKHISEKINQKWALIMSQYSEISIVEFLRKLKSFEKIISELEEYQ